MKIVVEVIAESMQYWQIAWMMNICTKMNQREKVNPKTERREAILSSFSFLNSSEA